MKTQILQVELHDDAISARDKMGWGQTGRILLVWPERGRVLNRRLDLVLLQRHSQSLGAQLALVTRDSDVRYHAYQLGIPVFKTLRQAQSAQWRLPRRLRRNQAASKPEAPAEEQPPLPLEERLPPRPQREKKPLSPLARLSIFSVGVLAVLAIAAALLPSAQLQLAPQTQMQEIQLILEADPQLEAINRTGSIPARKISVIVEGRDSIPVSGSVRLPENFSRGTVRFTNLTDGAVEISRGAVIRTAGSPALRFETTRSGRVSAGPGEQVDLPVQALSPGRQGNVESGSLIVIEGLLGTQLTVDNPLPTSGGSDRSAPAPNAADRKRLKDGLVKSLRLTALDELQDSLTTDDILLDGSLNLLQTLEETFTPEEDQPADQLSLNLRLEYEARMISGEDLRSIGEGLLDAKLQPDYSVVPQSLEIRSLSAPEWRGDSMRWRVSFRRMVQAVIKPATAIQLALGLAPLPAQDRLNALLPLEREPVITLTPHWWPRLPVLPFRIDVVTVNAIDAQ